MLATAARLLLEKTTPLEPSLTRSSGIASDETATIHFQLLARWRSSPSRPVLQRIFKAFQYRDFRLMWTGACLSAIGTWMQIVAQGWLIWKLSHSRFCWV